MELSFFPWENGEDPYWVNPENGLEWYVDVDLTDWCSRDNTTGLPPLKAVVFYVVEVKDDGRNPISRILIDRKTNKALADETTMDGMAVKIDMLRLSMQEI